MTSRIIARETLLTAARFRVDRVQYHLGDGQLATKEVIQHPGAVVIVPVLDDGRLCLIRNYRVAVDREMLELPAGTLEPGEPPIETAFRELIEETGFRAAEMVPMMDLFMSPGILLEHMHVFVARGLSAGAPAREAGEEIDNVLVPVAEALELIRSSAIVDSKSVSALLYYLTFIAPITQ